MHGPSGWADRTQNPSTRGGGGQCVYINKYSGWTVFTRCRPFDAEMLTVVSAQSSPFEYIFFCCLHSLTCKLKPQELYMTSNVIWQNQLKWNETVKPKFPQHDQIPTRGRNILDGV